MNGPRDYCFSCGREPEKGGEVPDNKGEDTMAYHLNPEKEEKVRALLKDHSIREIVTKTGVASETIRRIRNKNFTEGEKAELKKRATVKGRNKRELKKNKTEQNDMRFLVNQKTKICSKCKTEKPLSEFTVNSAMPDGLHNHCRGCKTGDQRARNAPNRIPSKAPETKTIIDESVPSSLSVIVRGKTVALPQEVELFEPPKLRNSEINKFINLRIPESFTFVDLAHKYLDYVVEHQEEIRVEIKKLAKEYFQMTTHLTLLEEFLCADKKDKELSEDNAFRKYIEMENDCMEEIP